MVKTSLATRMAYSFMALSVLVIGLAILFNTIINGSFIRDSLRRVLTGYSQTLTRAIRERPSLETVQALAAGHKVGIIFETGDSLYAVDGDGRNASVEDLLWESARKEIIQIPSPDGKRIIFIWNLLIFIPSHLPFLIALLVLLAGIIFATHLFLKSQLQPLQWLRVGVNEVARGNFKVQAPIIRNDEIGQVAGAFNKMTQRIEAMMTDRERLLADVSHELRSPIARINVALELLPEHPKRQAIKKDIREMETLIAVLLEREQVRAYLDRQETAVIQLNRLMRRVIDLYRDQPPGIHFSPPPDEITLSGDPTLIEVLVKNLLDNALKFSLKDSAAVRVSLEKKEGRVFVRIIDDGPGIPEQELERIFEPFVKLNPARGHRSGYGLGLDLCLRIVKAHGGQLRITSDGTRGACVEVIMNAG